MEITKQKLKLLSKGANSEVYLYQQAEIGVVLKMVLSSSKETKHLENQYTILKQINHENIIQTIKYSEKIKIKNNVGEETVRNILMLENASHGSMLTVIKKYHLTVPQCRWLFFQLCEAVQYLHCNYIVHRDLKLQNILLSDEKGRKVIKLADFGFAQSFMRNQHIIYFSQYKGTKKAYMAPQIHEVLKFPDKTYDAQKCDIFALGVILFIILLKKYPFEYATFEDNIYRLIIKQKYCQFWQQHAKSILQLEERQYSMVQDFKLLFIQMIKYNPKQRPSIQAVLQSQWILGTIRQVISL